MQFRESLRKSSMNQKVPTQYFNLDKVQYHSREPKKRRSKFQKYVEEQKPDYHHE